MKIKVYTAILFAIMLFVTCGSLEVYAWDDCPKGLVDDPYPGECSRYIDTDENGICDHSEPAPEDREPLNDKEVVLKDADIQNSKISETHESIVTGSRVESPLRKVLVASMAIMVPLFVLIGYVSVKRFTGKA